MGNFEKIAARKFVAIEKGGIEDKVFIEPADCLEAGIFHGPVVNVWAIEERLPRADDKKAERIGEIWAVGNSNLGDGEF